MNNKQWSEWIDRINTDKPAWLHSDTRIQAKNIDDEILGLGDWEFKARDCEWEEIKSYRYRLDNTETPEEKEELDRIEARQVADMVNNPPHYQSDNGIECIDAIRAALGKEQYEGYLRGACFKYIWRYNDKGGAESLKKARWYLDRIIEVYEKEESENR